MCGSYYQRVIPVSPPDILWRFFSPSSIHRHPLALPRFITPRCLLGYGHSVEIYFCGRCKSRPHYHVLVSHTPAMLIIASEIGPGAWVAGELASGSWNPMNEIVIVGPTHWLLNFVLRNTRQAMTFISMVFGKVNIERYTVGEELM